MGLRGRRVIERAMRLAKTEESPGPPGAVRILLKIFFEFRDGEIVKFASKKPDGVFKLALVRVGLFGRRRGGRFI